MVDRIVLPIGLIAHVERRRPLDRGLQRLSVVLSSPATGARAAATTPNSAMTAGSCMDRDIAAANGSRRNPSSAGTAARSQLLPAAAPARQGSPR